MSVYPVRDDGWRDLQQLVKVFRFTATKAQRNDVQKRIYNDIVSPLAADIRAAGMRSDGQSRIASRSVVARNLAKPTLLGGYGGGLPATLFWGAEFGGQSGKKKRTARISRKNPPFVVRATTMQFRPHRGKEGYWFHPMLRRQLPEVSAKIYRVVISEVLGDLVGRDAPGERVA